MTAQKDSGKKYHLQCTGVALETANKHIAEQDITLFGSCFCPFVQRVWVAFEYLGIPYKVHEVDPYAKPKELLEVSPKGLVPGVKLHKYEPPRALNESTVIMEYVVKLAQHNNISTSLFPSDPYANAIVRLQADHINRTLIPAFYRYLQAQDTAAQIEGGKDLLSAIEQLVSLFERAEKECGDALEGNPVGLWQETGTLSWSDIMAAPWLFRASNVLEHYRGFSLPKGPKFDAYIGRLFEHPAFKCTCSTEELYLDSYERYAYNRPNTSQVANAINSGRGLP
ncbi:uncharacterized protein STEHIDRAFT_121314 [Stereum hirsutum FP-91666 SS1]|uniref:uncharacterized protein n=1 Tax=Stereum hirsutum (strain FP-91666) TaxID=721885 RepID=UPI000440F1E3|nr:uncharacterized protein STEHIDRAFT_121314 [Stereum hirsutum FP-91666 SS1]EIM87705.1 hypothetical protein STEHIDRAFT_121314 [Stereum hirsutum FP-91666 SS1]